MRSSGGSSRVFRGLAIALVVFSSSTLVACLERFEDDSNPEQAECTSCHGGQLEVPFEAAPPFNLAGQTAAEDRGNGAHELHLRGSESSRALQCEECHLVPSTTYDEGHVDSPYPAELIFQGPAVAFKAEAFFDSESGTCRNTFCHGGSFVGFRPSGGTLTEPEWLDTSGAPGDCGACHSLPPPLPHPETGQCSECHKNITADMKFTRPDLHVDGIVTFFIPADD